MATYCFGCDDDITNSKVKRSLYSDASKHVRPLWFEIFDKELQTLGTAHTFGVRGLFQGSAMSDYVITRLPYLELIQITYLKLLNCSPSQSF